MKKAINFVRGSIRAEVACPYPERFINLCAQEGIEFWDLHCISKTDVRLTLPIKGYSKLRALAEKAGFDARPVKKTGVPFFLWKIRKRYVLLAGMVLMFAAVWSSSLFIWEIHVEGNDKVTTPEILSELKAHGIGIGTFGPSISSEAISNDLLMKLPRLSWIAINVSGSRADVLVRERIPKPEIVDENTPSMVYATKSGVITKMSVLEGARAVQEGATVEAGDVLVSGIMDSISSGRRTVHAMGEVTARTWYAFSAQIVLPASEKAYTGKTQTKTAVIIAGKRINLYLNGGIVFDDYDKITKTTVLRLPTGNILPIAFVKETYTDYKPSGTQMSLLTATELLEKRLLDRLNKTIGDDGQVITTTFDTAVNGDIVVVTLKAECTEQIAALRPFTAEEQQQAKEQPPKTNETEN
ncbi:sporulation protein YqfD [Oscillospiraceae bacterium CM]|nr:sporulation protein YqfD [Oscillospiraceae bacterium CM]